MLTSILLLTIALSLANAYADESKTFEGDMDNSRSEVFWMEVMFVTHRFQQIESEFTASCDRNVARKEMVSELQAAKDRITPLLQDAEDLTSVYGRVQKDLHQRIHDLKPCV